MDNPTHPREEGARAKPVDKLLAAAKAFGDARAAHDRSVRDWDGNREPLRTTAEAAIEAEYALHKAARAYATSVRRPQ